MNRRKNDGGWDVESQQKALKKTFVSFKIVIAALVFLAAVCVAFAIHYTL